MASFYFSPDPVDKPVETSLTLCSSALVNDDRVLYALSVCVSVCLYGQAERPKERRKGEEEQNVHVCIPSVAWLPLNFRSVSRSSVNY